MRVEFVTRICWAWFTCFPALAQFQDFAGTYSGSRFYFSTPTVLHGAAEQPGTARIFSYDGVFHPVPSEFPDGITSRPLSEPELSGDGLWLKYKRDPDPSGGCSVACFRQPESILLRPGEPPAVFEGNLHLPREGCVAALDHWVRGRFSPTGAIERINLCTNEREELSGSRSLPFRKGSVIASNGTVLSYGLLLVVFRGEMAILDTENQWGAISADGSTVVGERRGTDGVSRLILYDLSTGASQELGPSGRIFMRPMISDNGEWIVYFNETADGQQLSVIGRDGTNDRKLTEVPFGVTAATLTGDGKFVIAASGAGGIYRLSIRTGDCETLVESTPYPRTVSGASPGSLLTVTGAGLGEVERVFSAPLPWSSPSVGPLLDGNPVPLARAGNRLVDLQIPWDITPGIHRLEWPSASPFEHPVTIDVKETRPAVVSILDGDTRQPVTFDNPARPGGRIKLLGTGFGAVTPSVVSGSAGPDRPCAKVLTPYQFFVLAPFQQVPVSLEVVSMCFSPDSPGVYVIDLNLPRQSPVGTLYLLYRVSPSQEIFLLGNLEVRP